MLIRVDEVDSNDDAWVLSPLVIGPLLSWFGSSLSGSEAMLLPDGPSSQGFRLRGLLVLESCRKAVVIGNERNVPAVAQRRVTDHVTLREEILPRFML